jgi:ribosomal protein S6
MSYRLKSNEEVTKAFDKEQETNLQMLRSEIIKVTHEMRELQKRHKLATGKTFIVF